MRRFNGKAVYRLVGEKTPDRPPNVGEKFLMACVTPGAVAGNK